MCFSDGVLQPFRQLGWWKWMYHLSPFTYLIEALVGQGMIVLSLEISAVIQLSIPFQPSAVN